MTIGHLLWWGITDVQVPHAALRAALAAASFAVPLRPPSTKLVEQRARRAWAANDPAPFDEARAQFAGVTLVADGPAFWSDNRLVQPAPASAGWPWACPCKTAPCWHARLAKGLVVTRERLVELVAKEVGR